MTPDGSFSGEDFPRNLQQLVSRHSLGWLMAANFAGVIMAGLLLFPGLGTIFGEATYGRWAPLHLNWQLYGWCSLPLVGGLLRHFLAPSQEALKESRWVLLAWSLALLLGGVSWLQGTTTGKLFLDWRGFPRLVLVGALAGLWLVLFRHWSNGAGSFWSRVGDMLLLGGLASVPPLLWWSTGREVYPPIDPGTGGPTGASLLGSTLGIVAVLSQMPRLIGRTRSGSSVSGVGGFYFVLSCLVYAVIEHHNSSHHDWSQILGLGTLLGWIPLGFWFMKAFDWNPASRVWLHAALGWWTVLVTTGFAEFCPGLLEHVKFTHGLIAHSHIAMAGMLTSANMVILSNLSRETGGLCRAGNCLLWQGGLVIHLAALILLAWFEAFNPGWLLQRGSAVGILYGVRLVAGVMMATASVRWWLDLGEVRIKN